MEVRRFGNCCWVDKEGNVIGEDNLEVVSVDYIEWWNNEIFQILNGGDKNNFINYLIIMINKDYVERVLVYDVVIGFCYLIEDDFKYFRIQVDWRFVSDFKKGDFNFYLMDYINIGKYGDLFLFDWVKKDESVVMLGKIYDE